MQDTFGKFTVAFRQIIICRKHMTSIPAQREYRDAHERRQCFSLSGSHFGDPAVQHCQCALNLHREMPDPVFAAGNLTNQRTHLDRRSLIKCSKSGAATTLSSQLLQFHRRDRLQSLGFFDDPLGHPLPFPAAPGLRQDRQDSL